ncbi:MAG: bifunctional UDP-sugar hydrolase/5'-nucleotidase [Akkermansiaceae bacterium]
MSSRRRFLGTTSAWAASMAFARANSTDQKTISIIHTTDLHGHVLPTKTYSGKVVAGGFARCATKIRQWRKANPDSLLVDIGDLYQGTAVSYQNEGRLFVDLLDRFNYDAWSLGNHDFDWGPEALEKNLQAAKTSVLSANLLKSPNSVTPWKMAQVGGFKIALIGLVTPGLPFWLTPEALGGMAPVSPIEPLKKAMAEAKDAKADAVVVLGHYGHRKNDDFANPLRLTIKEATGIDVFIGGHTHVNRSSEFIGKSLYTQAGYFGMNCGRVDLTFDLQSRKLIQKEATTEFMGDAVELDPGVINSCEPELRASKEQLSRKIATLEKPITGKGRGSELANFICSSISDALKARDSPCDAVYHGTFGTGEVPMGPVTVADAWEMIPYENNVVTASLTPNQLLAILAEESYAASDRTLWPLEVIWEKRKPVRILKDGAELDPNQSIRVAFNSYDSQSAGKRLMRLRETVYLPSTKRKYVDINVRDVLIESFLNL